MYRIEVDGVTLYDPRLKDYAITAGKLTQELNTAGTLKLTIPKTNPSYGYYDLMKSKVTLYENDNIIFVGRPFAPAVDLYNLNDLEIEGELAYLNDAYIEPFNYYGPVSGLFSQFLDEYNAQVEEDKRFILGNVTVVNTTEAGNITRSSTEYLTAWEAFKTKFWGSALGGYCRIRYENGNRYIDYLADFDVISSQTVEQCINLVDGGKKVSSEDLATVILPLGAKYTVVDPITEEETEEYTTIESVNGGLKYIESQLGIAEYGRIVKIVKHDNITIPANLLTEAQRDLQKALGVETNIELTAVDLSKAGYTVGSFRVGEYVNVKVQNLNIDSRLLVRGLNINLLDPAGSLLKLGDSVKTFTAQQLQTAEAVQNISNNLSTETLRRSSAIERVRQETVSEINLAADSIYAEVANNFYNIDENNALLESIRTMITQTVQDITFEFNQFKNNTNSQFTEINKYIRFDNEGIHLGALGDPVEFLVGYNQSAFIENGTATSLWLQQQFAVDSVEARQSFKLAGFRYLIRDNGNVGVVKVD